MCDYPFFIPQVVLFANSSLFWFKVANEHREFRNYLSLCIKSTGNTISVLYSAPSRVASKHSIAAFALKFAS